MEQNNLNNNDYLQQQIADIQTNSVSSVPNINPQQPMSLAENPKPKKSNGALIAAIIFAVLALAGVGFGIFELMDSNKKSSEISDLRAKLSSAQSVSATPSEDDTDTKVLKLVDELKATAEEAVPNIIFTRTFNENDNGGPLIKNDELKTLTVGKSYGVASKYIALREGDEYVTPLVSALQNKLEELGFSEYAEVAGFPSYITGGNYFVSPDNNIVCALEYTGYIECSHISWASIDEEKTAFINELAEAYNDTQGVYPSYIKSISEQPKDSLVSPYQTIQVDCNHGVCLYYRTNPNAKWQFFANTQEAIPCVDYNTDDLKNAFAGSYCLNDNGEDSVVAPASATEPISTAEPVETSEEE